MCVYGIAASNHGNADIARELISWGADVNWRNAKGQTPLKVREQTEREREREREDLN